MFDHGDGWLFRGLDDRLYYVDYDPDYREGNGWQVNQVQLEHYGIEWYGENP